MTMTPDIYMDHSATTPLDPRVLEAMLPYFSEKYGNSKAMHSYGRDAEQALEESRETVARWLNCTPDEVVFTSGGSESDNLALRGPAQAARLQNRPFTLITTPIEHEAISVTARQLHATRTAALRIVSVDSAGCVDPDDLRAALQSLPRGGIAVVSIMYAHNEIGTRYPIEQYAAIAHEAGALFHTDAVQAAGQFSLDVEKLGVDMLSLSSHKFYGPKGAGLFYLREGVPFISTSTGASHEHHRRAGTHNTPGIVGTAVALDLACSNREAYVKRLSGLRNRLMNRLFNLVSDMRVTGDPRDRLASHASFAFKGVASSLLLVHLDHQGIAASSGSACKVGNEQPSSILEALGFGPEWTRGGLRLTLGHSTTEEDVDYVLEVLPDAVEKVRKLTAMMVT